MNRVVLTVVIVVVAALGAGPAVSAQPDPVRVMPLGDSITGSPGCVRATSAILDAYRALVGQMRAHNPAIPGWAAAMSTARSTNASGDQKISDRWYPAVAAAVST